MKAMSIIMFRALTDNARYTKLRIVRKQCDGYLSYRRLGKIISLPAASGVPCEIVRHVSGAEQSVEILSVQFSNMRCNECAMITQDDIIKVICDICGVTYVVSSFAILCYGDLTGTKSKFLDLILPRTCEHKRIAHIRSDRPIVIDIRIVTKANWRLPDNSLFVDPAYVDICNAA